MVFGWDKSREDYQEVYERQGGYDQPQKHEGKLSHELLAGAAAFAGFHEFEKHQREEGKPVTHEFAKEMLAGFAAGEADKLIETRGEDAWSAHRAREQAKENSQDLYQQYYERDGMPQQYDPDNSRPHEHVREHHRKHHDNDEW